MSNKELFKKNSGDLIQWVDDPDTFGMWEFTFDGKEFFNMFADYPDKLTQEQKKIFDAENPFWADFFKERNAG